MTDSCDEGDFSDCNWIFYRDRPEWKDVQPLPQNEGPYPVVRIAYSEKFRDIFDYFRAVLAKKEISERAFQLTEDAANANPSNYTVWNYRRTLLKELHKNLYDELKYIQVIIEENPKNYQVWHHRQVLVDWLVDPTFEKTLTEKVLAVDSKNYHAWQHRQWTIRKFQMYEGEMEFINKLLDDDIRNNSAWNQRYFILNITDKLSENLSSEIKYTLDSIAKAPMNESAWNYLRGILMDKGLTKVPAVSEYVETLYESGCRSPYLLGFIIDSIEERLLSGDDEELCKRALELCDQLAKKHDSVRKEYWNFVARNLGNLYGPEEAHARRSQSQDFSKGDLY